MMYEATDAVHNAAVDSETMSMAGDSVGDADRASGMGVGEDSVERLEVVSGYQVGASIVIADKEEFTVGSDYDNDVVLQYAEVEEPVRLQVQRQGGSRQIQLLEGRASIAEMELLSGEWYTLEAGSTVSVGRVIFMMTGLIHDVADEMGSLSHDSTAVLVRWLSVAKASMVIGFVLLGGMCVQANFLAGGAQAAVETTLQEQLAGFGLDNLDISEDGSHELIVRGRVDSREEFQTLRGLLRKKISVASLDVQIDDELVDGVEDIYRNHGAVADVEVLGQGHVRVKTEGVQEALMTEIEAALQADFPMIRKLESDNTFPEPEPQLEAVAYVDPDKEVEAVISGDVSYVVTRDQARYFVGSVLPSGHTIKAISEGTVVMLLKDKETQLSF